MAGAKAQARMRANTMHEVLPCMPGMPSISESIAYGVTGVNSQDIVLKLRSALYQPVAISCHWPLGLTLRLSESTNIGRAVEVMGG